MERPKNTLHTTGTPKIRHKRDWNASVPGTPAPPRKISQAGLLSSAEEAGVFSKLESAGAFSTAEKLLPILDDLKVLTVAESARRCALLFVFF